MKVAFRLANRSAQPSAPRGNRMSAFTLIELLVVVAIISILASIAVPNLVEAQTRAKVSRAKADMRTLSMALQIYRVDNEQYPPDVDGGGYPEVLEAWGSEIATFHMLTTPVAYLTTIPRDIFYASQSGTPRGVARKTLAYYEYSEELLHDPRPGNPRGNLEWANRMQATGCGFLVICMGPDRYGCFDWTPAHWEAVGRNVPWPGPTEPGATGRCIMYDPTNGTASDGDFICSAKGFYGGGGL